ncbi:MAG: NIPSNAP family protein [Arcicella sp.]|nr:NIPSNAP family protein [Arcicella sp.]
MITCYLKYIIDPFKVKEFEEYGKMWIPLVNEMGGIHHGYFLPHEGANNIGYCLFSFPSLAIYEEYRAKLATCEKCINAIKFAEETRCILSYERSFMKPIFE